MQRTVLLSIILFCSLFVSASHSQTIDGVEIVKPQIRFGKWDTTTKKLPVAIEFAVAPKWHLYWINPGDAGSPPEIKWQLPEGWDYTGVDFPAPKKLIEDDIISYVYFDKLVLTTEIIAPTDPAGKKITADIKWMVCKDLCVPGSKKLEATIGGKTYPVVSQALPRLIQSGIETWTMRNVNAPGDKSFQVKLSRKDAPVMVEDFFPDAIKNALLDFEIKGDALSYTIRPVDPAQAMGQVNGLIMVEGKAYWLR